MLNHGLHRGMLHLTSEMGMTTTMIVAIIFCCSLALPTRDAAIHGRRRSSSHSSSHFSLLGKSIYFVITDRFAHDADDHPPDCFGSAVWCGGSLRGLVRRLDYIAGMEFDCLWITPVVQQPSDVHCSAVQDENVDYCGTGYHGYWAEDFYRIDSRFGTPDDLLSLSLALKARGMGLGMQPAHVHTCSYSDTYRMLVIDILTCSSGHRTESCPPPIKHARRR